MRYIAHIISSVFQPLLMPVYSVALLFIYTYFRIILITKFWTVLLPAILFSFLIPGLLIFLLYKLKLISDLSLKVRSERFLPYLISLISYSLMIFFYYRMGMPTWFLMLMASTVVVIVLAIIITKWWKISAHMFGISGVLGGTMAISYFAEHTNPYFMFMGLFMIAGLVGTSRLILRRHTLYQVYGGFLLGYSVSFVFVWIGTL